MGRIADAWNALTGKTAPPKPLVGRVHAADANPFAEEDKGYKRLGASTRDKSLDGPAHQAMVSDSVRSFQRDSLARRWVRMKTSFVIGDEPCLVAEAEDDAVREQVQEALDEFQNDPVNALQQRLPNYVRNLYSTGGLCLLLAGAEVPGATKTRLGRVDQEDIERAIVDPDNADVRIGILRCGSGVMAERLVHPVVGPDGKLHPMFERLPLGTRVQLPVGTGSGKTDVSAIVGQACMYLGINDLSGQHLGISDLYPALDALQDYDDVSHGGTQRAILAMAYSHVRKVSKGTLDQQGMDALARDLSEQVSQNIGGVLVMTDDQDHSILNPTLAAADVKATADIPLRTVCIASGFPPHWFAEPGETNLATAGETASPVVAMLCEDQAAISRFFRAVILYALRRIPALRRLEEADPDALAFSFSFPALKGKDEVRASTVFTSDLASLVTLKSEGVLTTAAFQREAARLANEYGFEVEEDDIPDPDEIDAQKEAMRSAFSGLGSQDPNAPVEGDPEDEDAMSDQGEEPGDRRAA